MNGRRDRGIRDFVLAAAAAVVLVVVLGTATTAAAAAADVGNVSMYVGDADGFEDAESVEAAIDGGTLEPADEIVVGQVLVIAIESERLAGDLADRDGSTTDRFFATLGDGAALSLVQTNPTTMRPAKVLDPRPGNTTVYRSGTTAYVSMATGAVDLLWTPPQDDSVPGPELRGGERFAPKFGYGDATIRGATVEFRTVEAEFRGRYDPLAPERVNRTVAVYVEPDEAVKVRAALADGSIHTARPLAATGSHRFALDFRDVEPGTGYTLELVHDGDVVDRRAGIVRKPEASLRDPSVTVRGNGESAARLTVTAELSHGGTVVVVDGSGERIGAGCVPPGNATELSIGLRRGVGLTADSDPDELRVRAVRERPRGEKPYPGPGADLTVEVGGAGRETTDATRTATPSPMSSPVGTPTRVKGTDGTTGRGGPGLGIGSALAGLAGAAYLLERRPGRDGGGR